MRHLFRWTVALTLFAAIAFGISWLIYMPNSQERGTWRAQAGGMIITLNPLRADVYRATSISCIHQLSFPGHLKIVELAEGASVKVVEGRLHLLIDSDLGSTVFDRIDALPENCARANPDTATPRETFDVMWTAMNEHYAFFDLHGVDWQARHDLAPAADAQMSAEDLFEVFKMTLAGLDDGHVQLVADPLGYFSPALAPKWAQTAGLDRGELTKIALENIASPMTQIDGSLIEYALRDDGIGYILIPEMDIDNPLGVATGPATAQAFATVADALVDTKAIIIDIRYNPGGNDAVSFGIASHFIGKPTPAFSKSSRIGDTQGPSFEAIVQPFDDTPLTQPVILLTTRLTASGAEIFTMAMREIPQVIVMGEPTSGGLSDILDFDLPNGWRLGLSDQTYLTPDGSLYEAIGIPPDIKVEIDAAALGRGEDPLLEFAIEQALGQ
ncbi:MAG: S41 family peptidase [Paracoccaceae bacterium]